MKSIQRRLLQHVATMRTVLLLSFICSTLFALVSGLVYFVFMIPPTASTVVKFSHVLFQLYFAANIVLVLASWYEDTGFRQNGEGGVVLTFLLALVLCLVSVFVMVSVPNPAIEIYLLSLVEVFLIFVGLGRFFAS